MRVSRIALGGMICVLVLCVLAPVEGKRRRSVPPLTILDVAIAPVPFPVGDGSLTLTVSVKLPRTIRKTQMLEVSSLIASPSRRSMRFLFQRVPVQAATSDGRAQILHVTLSWDGKDQTRAYVPPGRYHYEVRAKLMEDHGNGFQAKLVSRHARGTIEVVSAPRGGKQEKAEGAFPVDDSSDEPPLEDLTEEEALQEDREDRSAQETLDQPPPTGLQESAADGQEDSPGDLPVSDLTEKPSSQVPRED